MSNKHNWTIEILIAVIGIMVTIYLHRIDTSLNWQKHDLSIIQEFQKAYFDDKANNVAQFYLPLLKDKNTKIALHRFITYDLMKKVVWNDKNKSQRYKFDEHDIHIYGLGSNFQDVFREDKEVGKRLYCDILGYGNGAYKDYTQKEQFGRVFKVADVGRAEAIRAPEDTILSIVAPCPKQHRIKGKAPRDISGDFLQCLRFESRFPFNVSIVFRRHWHCVTS